MMNCEERGSQNRIDRLNMVMNDIRRYLNILAEAMDAPSKLQPIAQINAALGGAGSVELRRGHAFGQRGRGRMSTSPSAWFFRFPADHVLAHQVVPIDDPRSKTPQEIVASAEEAHRRAEELRAEVAARQNIPGE